MLILRRGYTTIIDKAYAISKLRFLMSGRAGPSADSLALFDSKYHRNGPLEQHRSKAIELLLGGNKERLDQHIV